MINFKKLVNSFIPTKNGLHELLKENNFRFHILMAFAILFLSFLLKISISEWLFIILAIFGVLIAEGFNSAIETVVDLSTPHFDPLAKKAKDIAAFVVLMSSLAAVIIGSLIFIPKIFAFFP